MEFQRPKKLLLSVFLLFFMSLFFLARTLYEFIQAPLIPLQSSPQVITLNRSTSAFQFAQILKGKRLIPSTRLFVSIIRIKGLANQLKAGVYQIQPGETAMQLLNKVVAGQVLIQNFAIIAGTTQIKISQDLTQALYLDYTPDDWSEIKQNHPNAEGLLLADTYQYRGGSSGKNLLKQANENLMAYLNSSWQHRAPDLPYKTAYELLIAASIIEKETAIPQERQLISGVMVNRLNKNMPLQMDPTVIYALGNLYTGKLSHNDMQINSLYNSYRYRGLPPTPIAMIGKQAVDAAAHPQASKYLYFVAKGDGSHQFSQTYDQQRSAIEQYQR